MTDIAELMARDPLHLTKHPEELDAIIAYFRASRHMYQAGGRAERKASPKQKESIKLADKLDMDGIDL